MGSHTEESMFKWQAKRYCRATEDKWRRSRTGGRNVSMQGNLCNGVKLLKNFGFLSLLLRRHCWMWTTKLGLTP